jgi:hypothetical protein
VTSPAKQVAISSASVRSEWIPSIEPSVKDEGKSYDKDPKQSNAIGHLSATLGMPLCSGQQLGRTILGQTNPKVGLLIWFFFRAVRLYWGRCGW